ncbi:hypothetical protein [Comamonas thiooxydans]|uniref:hypothetical protein n=1 Tax=Comamonas thiooxydans TaxID=363952 RepID=UPI000B40B0F5|nr:hypothetical protein [Comamonas thiooxydans]
MSVRFAFRSYLSVNHLSAAAIFAKQCKEIEASARTAQIGSDGFRQHTALVVSSVILSAAFLEATINELFSDCADEHMRHIDPTLPAGNLMGRLWKKNVPRTAAYSILEKYEIALELNGKQNFALGASPYQDVKLLVELRNALIHFEPETVDGPSDDGAAKVHKFEKRFAGKFPTNPLVKQGNPFYPDKLLGAGCAEWAVKSSLAFADEFFARLGTLSKYAGARPKF